MKLVGLAILRNGVKYDYPFRESLRALSTVTEKTFLALGDSDDGTEAQLKDIGKIQIIPTVWDMKIRDDGIILGQQTNIALDAARQEFGQLEDAWGFYLQCDEMISEDEVGLICEDIKKAQESGCDVVSFRYLHFWQSFNKIAINKKWYPSEIRAVKLKSATESWGDAQSFRKFRKIYFSDAHIFHYGHVRAPEKYILKKHDMLKFYHTDEKLKKYQRRERKRDANTKCLDYLGGHPLLMKERMLALGAQWDEGSVPTLLTTGHTEVEAKMLKQVRAKKVRLIDSPCFFGPRQNEKFINLNQLEKKIPAKMDSKLAQNWDLALKFILKLSAAGVGCKRIGFS